MGGASTQEMPLFEVTPPAYFQGVQIRCDTDSIDPCEISERRSCHYFIVVFCRYYAPTNKIASLPDMKTSVPRGLQLHILIAVVNFPLATRSIRNLTSRTQQRFL